MSFVNCVKEFHEIGIDGHIRLRQHHSQQDAEACFRICSKRNYWNRGCVKAVCEFAIHDMNLVRIEAYANVDNTASNRSLEKAGFRLEGCLQKKWLIRGQSCDVNLWTLTAEREVN